MPSEAMPTGWWAPGSAPPRATGAGRRGLVMTDSTATTSSIWRPPISTTAWVRVLLRRSAGGVRPRVDYPIGTGDQAIAIVDANGYGKLDLILDDSEQITQ
jgi:hypothetical protein